MPAGGLRAEVERKLKEALGTYDVVLARVSKERYPERMLAITGAALRACRSVGYVSLSRPAETIIGQLESAGTSTKGLAVSTPPADDFLRVGLAVDKCLDEGRRCLVVDSVSTLMLYRKPIEVLQFVHNLIARIQSKGAKCVLVVLKGDVHEQYLDQLVMYTDIAVEC